jgi:hypothetical protein
MSPVFKKLNLKDQREIVVVNAPPSFESEIESLENVIVRRALVDSDVVFWLAFVTKQRELDELSAAAASRARGDAIVWFAYPKGSSKNYRCEFNRDSGWQVLGAAGFEPVRMVAIDADWSALRFRRADFIKSMTRGAEHALSARGKALAKGGPAQAAARSKRKTKTKRETKRK